MGLEKKKEKREKFPRNNAGGTQVRKCLIRIDGLLTMDICTNLISSQYYSHWDTSVRTYKDKYGEKTIQNNSAKKMQ